MFAWFSITSMFIHLYSHFSILSLQTSTCSESRMDTWITGNAKLYHPPFRYRCSVRTVRPSDKVYVDEILVLDRVDATKHESMFKAQYHVQQKSLEMEVSLNVFRPRWMLSQSLQIMLNIPYSRIRIQYMAKRGDFYTDLHCNHIHYIRELVGVANGDT